MYRVQAKKGVLEVKVRVQDNPACLAAAWPGFAGMQFPFVRLPDATSMLLELSDEVVFRWHCNDLPYELRVHFSFKKLTKDQGRSNMWSQVWLDDIDKDVRLHMDVSDEAPLLAHAMRRH